MNNNFITYVEFLLNDINNPELIQEWKLNLDAAVYDFFLNLTFINLQLKNKMIVVIATRTGQNQ